ncbi:MAG: hypothetical protein ACO1SV_02650 [Fimbriimonas sp.]
MSLAVVFAVAVSQAGRPSAVVEATQYWGAGRLALKKGEIAKFARQGGMRGVTQETVVLEDGTVIRTVRQHGRSTVITKWWLTKEERAALRKEIETTPFVRLRSGPRTDHTASAVDGVDDLFVARQKAKVQWWSSGHWKADTVPLFEQLRDLRPPTEISPGDALLNE